MKLPAKMRNRIGSLFAISLIMQRFILPGIVGIVCFSLGLWLHISWLRVLGIVLAAPIIWVYCVIIFVFFPWAIIDSIARRRR